MRIAVAPRLPPKPEKVKVEPLPLARFEVCVYVSGKLHVHFQGLGLSDYLRGIRQEHEYPSVRHGRCIRPDVPYEVIGAQPPAECLETKPPVTTQDDDRDVAGKLNGHQVPVGWKLGSLFSYQPARVYIRACQRCQGAVAQEAWGRDTRCLACARKVAVGLAMGTLLATIGSLQGLLWMLAYA